MYAKLKELLNLPASEIFIKLKSSENGLTLDTTKRRLKISGYNELSKVHKRSVVIDSLLRSVNPLAAILNGA